MPAPPPQPPAEILLLGALRTWPDPLPQLLAERLIDLHAASGPHQAAALLKDQGRFLALLVDPEHLSRRELRMMITVKRHVALPIWSLPTRHRKALISELGIIPWEDARRVLSRYVPQGLTPQAAQNDAPKSPSAVSSSPALPPPPPPPQRPIIHPKMPEKNAPKYLWQLILRIAMIKMTPRLCSLNLSSGHSWGLRTNRARHAQGRPACPQHPAPCLRPPPLTPAATRGRCCSSAPKPPPALR